MRPLTAVVLIALVAGLWISAYFCEIPAWIMRYFFGKNAGFPLTRKEKPCTRRIELTPVCPVCGKNWVIIDTSKPIGAKSAKYRNFCLMCRTSTKWLDTKAQAAEAWDNREVTLMPKDRNGGPHDNGTGE